MTIFKDTMTIQEINKLCSKKLPKTLTALDGSNATYTLNMVSLLYNDELTILDIVSKHTAVSGNTIVCVGEEVHVDHTTQLPDGVVLDRGPWSMIVYPNSEYYITYFGELPAFLKGLSWKVSEVPM